MPVQLKRIYDPATPEDGVRVLVDRLWPRGVAKTDARLDAWLKEVAPSTELRRWFGHDPERWHAFRQRYTDELAAPEAVTALARLASLADGGTLTLLYAAADTRHNHAIVLREQLLALMNSQA